WRLPRLWVTSHRLIGCARFRRHRRRADAHRIHRGEGFMSERSRRRERPKHLDHSPALDPAGLEGGRYRPLDEADVLRIHEAALSVLERTGVHVVESEARRILEAAGATVDRDFDRVYLPRRMAEAALRSANRRVVLFGRDGRFDLDLR